VIPSEVQQLINGMILGEVSLEIKGKNARLKIKQKDKEFVYHLHDLFNPLGIVGARENIRLENLLS